MSLKYMAETLCRTVSSLTRESSTRSKTAVEAAPLMDEPRVTFIMEPWRGLMPEMLWPEPRTIELRVARR